MKTNKFKIIFDTRGWEVCTNAHNAHDGKTTLIFFPKTPSTILLAVYRRCVDFFMFRYVFVRTVLLSILGYQGASNTHRFRHTALNPGFSLMQSISRFSTSETFCFFFSNLSYLLAANTLRPLHDP